MIVLFTGMSGIEIEKSLLKFSRNNRQLRKYQIEEPVVIKLDTKIKEVFFEDPENSTVIDTPSIWTDEILELTYPKLKQYWLRAFDKVSEEMNQALNNNPKAVIFINLHACYFHNETQEYISLAVLEKIASLKPNLIITLIDDVYEIYHRLTLSGGIFHKNDEPNLAEFILRHIRLLDWRSKETLLARFYSENIPDCSHYLFAVKHPIETLHNLIFENRKTVYLSHPITEVRRLQRDNKDNEAKEIMNEINEISDELTLKFTAFLPTTIDEFRIDFNSKEVDKTTKNGKLIKVEHIEYFSSLTKRWEQEKYDEDKSYVYINSGFKDVNSFWKKERATEVDTHTNHLLEILSDIISVQVTVRDYTLTEQSHFLVLYRPMFNGNPSKGVRKELSYFKRMKRDSKKDLHFFIYSPQDDIDNFYVRQYVKRLENEGKLGRIEFETDFREKDFDSYLKTELLNLKSSIPQLYSFFDIAKQRLSFHIIDPSGRRTPLGDDYYKEFRKNFSKKYFDVCAEILELYTQDCCYFETNKAVSILQFIKTVDEHLSTNHLPNK